MRAEERLERLREVWPQIERPVAAIAAELGTSPSEVCRQAKRLGLPRRAWLRWPPRPRTDGRASRI